jgi:F1F0 ATPase subunit 2
MDAQAMTKFLFAQQDVIASAFIVGAWLAAGAATGALYFLTLRWNVRMFAAARPPVLALALAVQLARFAAIAGVLAVVAVHFGALPLLVATAGILVARTVFLRWGVRS